MDTTFLSILCFYLCILLLLQLFYFSDPSDYPSDCSLNESYSDGFVDITPLIEGKKVNTIPRYQPVCIKNLRNVFRYTDLNEVQCLTEKEDSKTCIDTIDFEECTKIGRPLPHYWATCPDKVFENPSDPCSIARNQFRMIYSDQEQVHKGVLETRLRDRQRRREQIIKTINTPKPQKRPTPPPPPRPQKTSSMTKRIRR